MQPRLLSAVLHQAGIIRTADYNDAGRDARIGEETVPDRMAAQRDAEGEVSRYGEMKRKIGGQVRQEMRSVDCRAMVNREHVLRMAWVAAPPSFIGDFVHLP